MEVIEFPKNFDKSSRTNLFRKYVWKLENGRYMLLPIESPEVNLTKKEIAEEPKEEKETEKKIKVAIQDNRQKFREGTMVMTEWGIGKISKINENQMAVVKIEGNDVEFPLSSINYSLTIHCCILCKDSTVWAEIKIGFDYTINTLKMKIAKILKCHYSQIIIVHSGKKIENNINLFELGIYEMDVFLAVVKDRQEYSVSRFRSHKTISRNYIYNAISFKVNHDIWLTGVGFYITKGSESFYDLFIYEEPNNKWVYSEKKILIRETNSKDNPIKKHKISQLEIKANQLYSIHQYLLSSESQQIVGIKSADIFEETETSISFNFYNCNIVTKMNNSSIEEGLIPVLYYYIKTD